MTISKKIRELREENSMLQRELASVLKIGVRHLGKIERNQKRHLITISHLFNCSYQELKTLWIASKPMNV